MKASRKLLYLLSFAGLAGTAALAIDRIGRPSMAPLLLWAVIVATLAGAPGLVHRRAWPAAVALLPLGAYLVMRTQMAIPSDVHGLGGQLYFYLAQLRAGGAIYTTRPLPFDFSAAAELRLLLSLVVYAATGVAAFAALSLRKALPAIVVVLVLLGFGLTTDQVERIVWLPLAFLLLAGCLLMLSRSLQRQRWRSGDALAGVATAVSASLLALFLLGTTPVAAGKPWQDWRAWGPIGAKSAATHLVFNWMIDYPALLDPASDAQVMVVRSPLPSYWRANALDCFNGISWFTGSSPSSPLAAEPGSAAGTYRVPSLGPDPPGKPVTEVFQLKSFTSDYFFTGGTPTTLLFGREAPMHTLATHTLAGQHLLGPELEYTLQAVVPQLRPTDLIGRGRDYPPEALAETTLPFPTPAQMGESASESAWRSTLAGDPSRQEWRGLYKLSRAIVGQATDPYEIALRIEEYLRATYSYSLTPPATSFQSPYAAFLFKTRAGYCQQFAGAMAVLLRFNGIPSRVAVGFATGRPGKNDTFVVSRTDAHAWVEAFFPSVGWAPFDPTPGRSIPGPGASSTSAGFTDPFVGAAGGAGGRQADLTAAAANRQKDPKANHDGGGTPLPEPPRSPRWLPWSGALAALLLAWPMGRALVKALLRRRGLRRGDVGRRLQALLALTRAELEDHGVDVSPSQTLEETARLLNDRFGLDATVLAGRVQAVLFGGRTATDDDLAQLAALRRELKRRLRAHGGRLRRLLALYGLPADAH